MRASHVFGGREEQNFWECAECSAVYLYPAPSVEEEKRFYAREFEKFMASRAEGDRDWSNTEEHKRTNQDQVRRRWAFIEEYVRSGSSVLEIGCSTGFMLDALRDAGMVCTGVEPSGEFLPYLAQQGYEAYESFDDVESSRRFDLIVHFFVFEHIRDPYAFLTQIWEQLAPGGVMIAEIPCVNDPLTSVYDIPAFEQFYWSVAHHYYYSPKALSYILDKLKLPYSLKPEQRYDLSNHMHWMMSGKPGGQGRYSDIFGEQANVEYKNGLKKAWACDTIFLYIWKDSHSKQA